MQKHDMLTLTPYVDRFSTATDKKAEQMYSKLKNITYTYPTTWGERLGIGKPINYTYSVDADKHITLLLYFANRKYPIAHTDYELRPSKKHPPKVKRIHKYGYSLAKTTKKPLLFDGKYKDASGQVFYTSQECDKLAGFKIAHRRKEIRFVKYKNKRSD